MKPILLFIIRSLMFLILMVTADQVIGFMFKKLYFGQHVGQFSQTTYAIDSANQDIMIFGSSRAVRHYSSAIISHGSGLSCYNSGRDGMMIPYSSAMEEITLDRHKPKLMILDITPRELGVDRSKYEKLTILLPYCGEHKQFIKYIDKVSEFEPYKLVSKTYPYNSSIFILATNALFPKSEKKDMNGYLPLDGSMTKVEMNDYRERMIIRSEKIRQKTEVPEARGVAYYKKFLDNSAKNHIKTLVVISPTILKNPFYLDNQTAEKEVIINLAKKYPNVTLLDYSSDPRFNNHAEKFADVFHLNKKGSEEFSTDLAAYIKNNNLGASKLN